MILLDATGLAASRPGRTLFEDASLTLSSGDRLGLVGINGTGKSTLLRVLAGTTQPEAGTVRRGRGARGRHAGPGRRPSGRERSATRSRAVRDPDRGWEVDAVLDRLGMAPVADVDTGRLSGGQAKRTALARALVEVGPGGGPDDDAVLLILDEPTNHLDIDAIGWLEDRLAVPSRRPHPGHPRSPRPRPPHQPHPRARPGTGVRARGRLRRPTWRPGPRTRRGRRDRGAGPAQPGAARAGVAPTGRAGAHVASRRRGSRRRLRSWGRRATEPARRGELPLHVGDAAARRPW